MKCVGGEWKYSVGIFLMGKRCGAHSSHRGIKVRVRAADAGVHLGEERRLLQAMTSCEEPQDWAGGYWCTTIMVVWLTNNDTLSARFSKSHQAVCQVSLHR